MDIIKTRSALTMTQRKIEPICQKEGAIERQRSYKIGWGKLLVKKQAISISIYRGEDKTGSVA